MGPAEVQQPSLTQIALIQKSPNRRAAKCADADYAADNDKTYDAGLSSEERERRDVVDPDLSDRPQGAQTAPITVQQTFQLSEQDSTSNRVSTHSPSTVARQLRVDTSATIFDQVSPISA